MFSHTAHVMTLANSIIGVGILAMPFCFQKCGILLSIVLLVLSNWITRICCHYLIKTSLLSRRKSFELLGLHAFGASGKLLAELCIIGYLIGTCITYFVVVGDLGPQIIGKMFSIDPTEYKHLRTIVMLVVTFICIIPLGMLRNVDSLSALCTASIGFYVCLMLKIVLESEPHIVANDWTEKVTYWEPGGVLQCLPIFSMALSCQMQLFEVFESINNQSLEKLNNIVKNATWICTLVYIAVGFFGYVAFCTHNFSGNILLNLTPSFGSDIIKVGFVLSIAFSFPLVIFPCRASIYSLLYRKQGHAESSNYIPEQRFRAITLFIVGCSLCVALVIPSVELVIGLVGSTIGVAICIMFPATSFRKIIKKDSTERTFAQFICISGLCLMILGTYANLNAIDEQSSGPQIDVAQLVTPLSQVPNDGPPANIELQLQNSELLKHLVKEPDPKSANVLVPLPEVKSPTLNDDPIKVDDKAIQQPDPPKKQPMPPLPVDETHLDMDNKKAAIVEKPKIIPEAPIKPVEEGAEPAAPTQNKNITIEPKAKPPSIMLTPRVQEKAKPLQIGVPVQQSIDGAAIKKEEEIAAEEQKENKVNVDELRKTQNELKKTKELLERTVDELKEELAKQNKETQNLVVEKLGEVVEKVEQIERKVKTEDAKPSAIQPAQAHQIKPMVVEASPQNPEVLKPKASLMDLLTENAHAREEQEAHAGIFEPLSYKTGELLQNASAVAPAAGPLPQLALKQPQAERLGPLPLPLLINATQPKPKDTLNTELPKAPVSSGDNRTADAEKVEVIRRELLNYKISPEMATTLMPLARIKREANENCLPEPKLNEMAGGGGASIGLQIENIGRDLKSVKEDYDDHMMANSEVKEDAGSINTIPITT